MDLAALLAVSGVLWFFGVIFVFRFLFTANWLARRASRALERHHYDRALALYQRLGEAAGTHSKSKFRQAIRFLSHQGQGLAQQALDEYPDAIDHFESARELLAEGVEMPPPVHAQVDCWLAVAYFALAQQGEGEKALRRLNALCDQLDEDDIGPTMDLLRDGAGLASISNQIPLAIELLNLALRRLQNSHDAHSALIASTEIRLAEIYVLNGDYQMGVDLLEKTLSEGQLEDHQKINAQASLGNALLVFGDIRRSIECLQEVRKSRERVSGEHEVAMTESSLGVHLRIYGDYIESEKIGDEAQRRLNRLYPDDNFLVRNSYVQFVPSLMHRGDYPKADLLLRKLESVPENVATHQGSLLSSTFLWRGIYFLRLFHESQSRGF